MDKKKIIIFIITLIFGSIILFFEFSYLLRDDKEYYNYENVIGNSFIAADDSYIVFKKDKTFYWYQDRNNLNDNYYYGTYEIYNTDIKTNTGSTILTATIKNISINYLLI